MTWNLQTSESELPATLQGTVGEETVKLEGVFRLQQKYLRGIPAGRSFSGGSVLGTLSRAQFNAAVEPVVTRHPQLGRLNAVVATGTHDDRQFEIFATRTGHPKRGDRAAVGHIRGNYDGQTVHLDLTATEQFGDTEVAGACPAPSAFSILLVAALLFFA